MCATFARTRQQRNAPCCFGASDERERERERASRPTVIKRCKCRIYNLTRCGSRAYAQGVGSPCVRSFLVGRNVLFFFFLFLTQQTATSQEGETHTKKATAYLGYNLRLMKVWVSDKLPLNCWAGGGRSRRLLRGAGESRLPEGGLLRATWE